MCKFIQAKINILRKTTNNLKKIKILKKESELSHSLFNINILIFFI